MMNFLVWVENLGLSTWIREGRSLLAFPTLLFLHTLGMSFVAGGSSLIAMGILGLWPQSSLKSLEKIYPAIWVGFWVNAVTGVLILLAWATKELTNPDFYIKMTFVFAGLALLRVMRTRVFGDPTLETAPVAPMAKILAWATLACWFGAIVSGRLLGYT
jgi:hypothetical protein